MKELVFDQSDMQRRIARFEQLDVMESQKTGMPLEVQDIIFSRRLMPVITLNQTTQAESPFGKLAPIHGAGGMAMLYAECPPDTGPSLHRHLRTHETFTVIRGRFEFFWGEEGSESMVLDPLDVISIPPGISREFRNVSESDGLVQVIITGDDQDMNDIEFPEATAHKIEEYGPEYLEQFKKLGMIFVTSDD